MKTKKLSLKSVKVKSFTTGKDKILGKGMSGNNETVECPPGTQYCNSGVHSCLNSPC